MILAVTAGKGGVGKSTIAYNLGAALDAVVVDADLSMADLPASRGPDLHDVLAGRAHPVEAVDDSGPVSLLPCGRSLAGARAADASALVDAVEAVAREYGRVVVDSPAGLCSDAGIPVLAADACLLVTRPTRPALAGSLRTRELARAVETPLVRVALNRIAGTVDTDRIASLLGAPVVSFPESSLLARAQESGRPVRSIAPESTVARRFDTLAADIRAALATGRRP